MDKDSILAILGLTTDDIEPPPPGVFERALRFAFQSPPIHDNSSLPATL